MQQSAITLEPIRITGSAANGWIGLAMDNLFSSYSVGKEGFKGPKTKMCQKLMKFCRVWPYYSEAFEPIFTVVTLTT